MLDIPLVVWRVGGGPIQIRKLRAHKKVTESEIKRTQELMDAYDVVHLKARVSEEGVFGVAKALLVEFAGKFHSDAELSRHARTLQEPVTFEDSQFGKFILDRRVSWFQTETFWRASKVKLILHASESEDVQKLLATARQIWKERAKWNKRITDFAVLRLLNLKNDAWVDEDSQKVTAEQFANGMRLNSVVVHPDGDFVFWHDDGDLFWGHAITVSGNLRTGPTDADIPG